MDSTEECDPIVYRSCFMRGWWVIDCEHHETVQFQQLFSAAIGAALLHRSAAIR